MIQLEDRAIELLSIINDMKVATEVEIMTSFSAEPEEIKDMIRLLEKNDLITRDYQLTKSIGSNFGEAYKTTRLAFKYLR